MHCSETEAISIEAVIQLASSLQTTVIERFKINLIDNEGFKMLAQSLPKTLVHLDLSCNRMSEDSIPTLHSYLKSNGKNLKELIFDCNLTTKYLEEQESSSLSTLKIIRNDSYQAYLFCNEIPLSMYPLHTSDSQWSELFMELKKYDTIGHKIQLNFSEKYNPNQFHYVRNLLDKQFRVTSLIINSIILRIHRRNLIYFDK